MNYDVFNNKQQIKKEVTQDEKNFEYVHKNIPDDYELGEKKVQLKLKFFYDYNGQEMTYKNAQVVSNEKI